jgi:hypothetical protein
MDESARMDPVSQLLGLRNYGRKLRVMPTGKSRLVTTPSVKGTSLRHVPLTEGVTSRGEE